MRAAKDKPGSSNPADERGRQKRQQSFLQNRSLLSGAGDCLSATSPGRPLGRRHTARLSREGGVVAVPIPAVGHEAEAGEADDHHRPS